MCANREVWANPRGSQEIEAFEQERLYRAPFTVVQPCKVRRVA